MIWILLPILFLVSLFCSAICIKDEEAQDTLIIASLVFFVASLIIAVSMVFSGVSVYPKLKGLQQEALSLKSEIKTIKEAQYQNVSSGRLVGGSLDNFQQSKALSEYISKYAEKKAEYNRELTETKTRKCILIYKLFGDTLFISKKVLQLKEIP